MVANETPERVAERELPHRVDFEEVSDGPVSVAVVEALAAVEEVRPMEVDVRLYDYLDTDALDKLFDHAGVNGRGGWTIEFSVDGYDVTVSGDGTVTVA